MWQGRDQRSKITSQVLASELPLRISAFAIWERLARTVKTVSHFAIPSTVLYWLPSYSNLIQPHVTQLVIAMDEDSVLERLLISLVSVISASLENIARLRTDLLNQLLYPSSTVSSSFSSRNHTISVSHPYQHIAHPMFQIPCNCKCYRARNNIYYTSKVRENGRDYESKWLCTSREELHPQCRLIVTSSSCDDNRLPRTLQYPFWFILSSLSPPPPPSFSLPLTHPLRRT